MGIKRIYIKKELNKNIPKKEKSKKIYSNIKMLFIFFFLTYNKKREIIFFS
jgi:hypothetical protein